MAGLYDALTRDLVFLYKGDNITVKTNPALTASGWDGGQFVRWYADGTGELTIALANGVFCGFLPFGSDEDSDQFTALTESDVTYKKAVLYFGGNIYYTRTYETETYKSRHAIDPYTPLVYTANQILYVSENGKLTNEDESDPAVNPGGLFPDGDPIVLPFNPVGWTTVPPVVGTKNYLGVHTNGV